MQCSIIGITVKTFKKERMMRMFSEEKLEEYERNGYLERLDEVMEGDRKIGIREFDYAFGKEWEFILPETIEEKGFHNIFISRKLIKKYKLNETSIKQKVYEILPKDVFTSLQHVFVLYQQSDMHYVRNYFTKKYPNRNIEEENSKVWNFGEFCDNADVGFFFGMYDCIFVNMRKIEKVIRESSDMPKQVKACLNDEFWKTLLHESCHAMASNPALNLDYLGYRESADEEEWSEKTALLLYYNEAPYDKYDIFH